MIPAQKLRYGECRTCGRRCALTFHHLIPKKVHRRPRFRKCYSKEELAEGIDVCRLCHNGIHALYDEMTLAGQFNTSALLISDPALQKHFQWAGRQKVRE